MTRSELDRLASLFAKAGTPLPNIGGGQPATVAWSKDSYGINRFTATYPNGAVATGVAGHGGFHVLETRGGGAVEPSRHSQNAPDIPREDRPPVPKPPPDPEEEEEDDDDDDDEQPQPFEPTVGPTPPSGPPPDLQRLLEPNPYDGRPDSRTTFGQPRDYGAGVPGRPAAMGIPADTTGRTMARNDLPPFPFGPEQPVEWPQHTPPVGQPGPLGDIGVDVGWGTQGGAGWQALHRKSTGWSRQQMTRVPSAYKALHQVGRRPLY